MVANHQEYQVCRGFVVLCLTVELALRLMLQWLVIGFALGCLRSLQSLAALHQLATVAMPFALTLAASYPD